MLYVYSQIYIESLNKIKKIRDVESEFNYLRCSGHYFEDKIYDNIMNKIDGVKVHNKDYIETKFGPTSLTSLSTGCKALLLAVYYSKMPNVVINIVEAGENAIEMLFEISKITDIRVYTSQSLLIYNSRAECFINDEHIKNGVYIYNKMEKENGRYK